MIIALAAVVLIGGVVLLIATLRGGDGSTQTASGGTTPADRTATTSPGPEATSSGALTPNTAHTTDPGTQAAVVLPATSEIFQQPVQVATERLRAAGLVVTQGNSGCSNSTQPGMVRQVTRGSELNARILYGKSTDQIDTDAATALRPGDEVTVWTPDRNPC